MLLESSPAFLSPGHCFKASEKLSSAFTSSFVGSLVGLAPVLSGTAMLGVRGVLGVRTHREEQSK